MQFKIETIFPYKSSQWTFRENQWRTLFTRAFHAGEITDTVESIKCFSNFRFSILIVIYNCIIEIR
jgi:hypothetical protein